jgi:integrase/recombinase XerD
MNLRVNLTKRVKTDEGLRYCPAVQSENGRIKPDWVIVDRRQENGIEEKHPEGSYYIEWRDGAKRRRLSVGNDAPTAFTRMIRKEAELNAVANGIAIAVEPAPNEVDGDKNSIAVAAASFLEQTKLTGKPKTFAAYRVSIAYFQESCSKLYMEDIQRLDMIKFANSLKSKSLMPRTCWNKFNNVMSFLKANGIRGVVQKNDWPKFVEEEPEVYDREDIAALMGVSDTEEQLWWDFFLMTGFREQEVMYTAWRNVNFTHNTVAVQWKPEYNWTPKAYKERTVTIPAKLVAKLKKAKANAKVGCPLVFPTSGGKPKFDFLDCLKAAAKRANLDPDECYLHKFRATFATWSLWAGVDLRTVQSWLGHEDMESTLRYLKPSRSPETLAKVDAIFA